MTTSVGLTTNIIDTWAKCTICDKLLTETDQDLIYLKCKHIFHRVCGIKHLYCKRCDRATTINYTLVRGSDGGIPGYFTIAKKFLE